MRKGAAAGSSPIPVRRPPLPLPLPTSSTCPTFCCSRLGLEELHALVEQAETMAFPDASLVDQLRVVTAEADKVATMAQQLLNGKRQTR